MVESQRCVAIQHWCSKVKIAGMSWVNLLIVYSGLLWITYFIVFYLKYFVDIIFFSKANFFFFSMIFDSMIHWSVDSALLPSECLVNGGGAWWFYFYFWISYTVTLWVLNLRTYPPSHYKEEEVSDELELIGSQLWKMNYMIRMTFIYDPLCYIGRMDSFDRERKEPFLPL